MILCGWCGKPTPDKPRCSACEHTDPRTPYVQRGEDVPTVTLTGRPGSDKRETAKRLNEARNAGHTTVESIAEYLDVSPRTVRRWQEMSRS